MSTPISRAVFLKVLAGCGVAAVAGKLALDAPLLKGSSERIRCRMLGPSSKLGHRLRQSAGNETITGTQSTRVTIIGGGIAGLSAAWWLKKHGVNDFVILELEKEVGGNSASSSSAYGAFPWGAHYVPIANPESHYVRQLFEELKIIQGYNAAGEPVYDELMLCHEPQDRLYKDGSFHEGLVPKRGLQPNESAEVARFFEVMLSFRRATGSDGKLAFTIPLDLSSQDQEFTALDGISMSQWLKDNNFKSQPLLWYVNYCCRDDYGSSTENVSAWAGIHYFAGRRGTAANSEPNAVLTWPQGNGFLVEKLKAPVQGSICNNQMATAVKQKGGKVITTCLHSDTNEYSAIESEFVIFAAPRYVANHVIKDEKQTEATHTQTKHTQTTHTQTSDINLSYAPWMVANISLKRLPDSRGLAPAWDNVSYYSDSLGYVISNHQDISTRQKPTVITYYFPLSQMQPKAARQKLFQSSKEEWSKIIIEDLKSMHPNIENDILSIDLWPWGHGLIRPTVGLIWGQDRKRMKEAKGNILFAHSDMSGMSNFEEAQYHGVEAAKMVLKKLES